MRGRRQAQCPDAVRSRDIRPPGRCFAARQAGTGRALLLMAPGWIRTALGGPDAPFTIEENIPRVVDVLLSKLGRPGLEYLDYLGRTVPW